MKRLKGIHRDNDPIDQPEGSYRDAINMLLTKQKGAITSEEGNELQDSLQAGYTLIGHTLVYDGSFILFSTDGTDSEIGLFQDGVYTSVINKVELNFSPSSILEAVAVINNKNEIVVYWTDNINPPRYYNITKGEAITDIDSIRLFPSIDNVPVIGLTGVNNGGQLLSGAYHFGIRLIAADNSKTSYMMFTPAVSITDDADEFNPTQYDGVASGTVTSKEINLSITNLDVNYESFQVCVIRKEADTIAEVLELEPQPISDSTSTLSYSGATGTQVAYEDVIIPNANYETAKTIAEQDNTLYMGNVSKNAPVDFQKYANNIKVKPAYKNIGPEGDSIEIGSHYGRPTVSFYDKSFKRGEVYAIYISFVLKNGEESKAFHIPGRAPLARETDTTTNDEYTYIDAAHKKFQFESNPDFTYGMGYWENENETYPADDSSGTWEIWDVDTNGDGAIKSSGETTLWGKNVRHHHFPDNKKYFDPATDNRVNALGFTLEDVKIPANLLSQIRGVKVYYAERTDVNKRILDQGNILPMRTWGDYYVFNVEFLQQQSLSNINTVRMSAFQSARIKLNLGTATHLKLLYAPTGYQLGDYITSGKDNGYYLNQKTNMQYVAGTKQNKIRPIKNGTAITYLQRNSIVNATEKGFNFDIYNEDGEEGIGVQVDGNFPIDFSGLGSWTNGNAGENFMLIGEICSHKTELYAPFDQQVLVWTGAIFTDLSIFDPRTAVSGTNNYAEGTISVNSAADSAVSIPASFEKVIDPFSITGEDVTLEVDIGGNVAQLDLLLTDSELPFDTLTEVEAAIEIASIINTDTGLSGYTASSNNGTIRVESTTGGTVDNGTSINILTVDKPTSGYFRPIAGQLSGGSSGQISITFVSSDGVINQSIDVPVTNNQTNDNIASAIETAFNAAPATLTNNYSISVNLVPTNPVLTITADNYGRIYDATITIDIKKSGIDFGINPIVGGSAVGESDTPLHTMSNIFGGDIFISSYAPRVSGVGNGDGGHPFNEEIRLLFDFVCESTDNIKLRHEGQSPWELYFPKSGKEEVLNIEKDFPDGGRDLANFIAYNPDYSAKALIKTPAPALKSDDTITRFPTRIIRSLRGDSNIGEDEGLRTFLENDFIDLTRKRGELVKLSILQNIIIPHMERALIRTKARQEMLVGDIRAFVGAGDIFAVDPDELITTEVGFGGLQDQRCALSTPHGYFFVDRNAGEVVLVGERPEVISDYGLRNHFKDTLPDINKNELICTYDSKWDRILLTHKGNWTLSYYPALKAWGSFHSYTPDYYLYDLNTFYSVNDNAGTLDLYKHNIATKSSEFYGTLEESVFEFIENRAPSVTKVFFNLEMMTEVIDNTGASLPKETFSTFQVFNDLQDSGVKTISYFDWNGGNARNIEGTWKTNDFRNMLVAGVVDPAKEWYNQDRFRGKWCAVRLTFDNNANKHIQIYSTKMGARQSLR